MFFQNRDKTHAILIPPLLHYLWERGLGGEVRSCCYSPLITSFASSLPSRPPRILAEVRLALLKEGVLAVAAFLGHVIQHRRVAGQHLHTRLSIQIGVHRCLQEADRDRTL